MNHSVEQSEAGAHDCVHDEPHVIEHDCHLALNHSETKNEEKQEHEPETAFSKIVGLMDIAGVFASTLCTVHCVVVPVLVALMPVFARSVLENDFVHIGLAGFVLTFCVVAFVPGYLRHHDKRLILLGVLGVGLVFFATFVARQWGELAEASIITLGNLIVIFGHLLNRKLLAHVKCKHL